MNKLEILAGDARESIVAVLSDLAIRKLSAYVWYLKTDKKQAVRTLASGVSFFDAAVLVSLNIDENSDIRQEFLRIKNFVINGCPDYNDLSDDIDALSMIAFYINNNESERVPRATSLLEFW